MEWVKKLFCVFFLSSNGATDKTPLSTEFQTVPNQNHYICIWVDHSKLTCILERYLLGQRVLFYFASKNL